MQLIMTKLGFSIDSETLGVKVPNSSEIMKYQNDIEIKIDGRIIAIGSVKTFCMMFKGLEKSQIIK